MSSVKQLCVACSLPALCAVVLGVICMFDRAVYAMDNNIPPTYERCKPAIVEPWLGVCEFREYTGPYSDYGCVNVQDCDGVHPSKIVIDADCVESSNPNDRCNPVITSTDVVMYNHACGYINAVIGGTTCACVRDIVGYGTVSYLKCPQ